MKYLLSNIRATVSLVLWLKIYSRRPNVASCFGSRTNASFFKHDLEFEVCLTCYLLIRTLK